MAARAFARVAPVRAKVSLVILAMLGCALTLRVWASCRFATGRSSRAPRSRSTTRPSSRSRSAARSSTATAACWCARCRPSRSTPCRREVTDPHRDGGQARSDPRQARRPPRARAARHAAFRWLARKVPHDVAERVDALQIAGIGPKAEETGRRFVASGRLASTVARLHRHRRERARRARVRVRPTAARHVRARCASKPTSSGARSRSATRRCVDTRGRRARRRHDARPVHAVRGRAPAARRDVKKWSARERHGDRDGSVDRRAAGGRQHARLRSGAFRRVVARRVARPRGQRRVRAGLDVQARSPRRPRSRAASVTLDARFPARDAHRGRRTHDPQRRGRHDGRDIGSSESIEDIIAYSHNVGAAEVGLAIGQSAMYRDDRSVRFRRPDRRRAARRELRASSPPPSEWSGIVAGDDLVRSRDLDDADRADARLRGDRERRAARAPAHRPRDRGPRRQGRAPVRPPSSNAASCRSDGGDAARAICAPSSLRGTGNPTARVAGLHDRGQDGHGAGRRKRRATSPARTSPRSSA